MSLSRRRFLALGAAIPLAFATGQWAETLAQSGQDVSYPKLPEVTAAKSAVATRIREVSNEPLALIFSSFEFTTEAAAKSGFSVVQDHLTTTAKADLDSYAPISIGKLGDDRFALYSSDGIHPWSIKLMVRVGQTILEFGSFGTTGDIDAYVVDFLGGFLEGNHTWNAESIIPTLADLPVGWTRIPDDGTIDILDKVHGS